MAVTRGDADTTIDVDGLVSSIKVAMTQYGLFMKPRRCIFKTPRPLLEHNRKAYIPIAFSIGPFHHGKSNLKVTETIKAKYLKGFLKRSKAKLEDIINSINNLESKARECYAGPIGYSRKEFVKMLVIDGCFIIELLWRNIDSKKHREKNDPIFGMSSMVGVLGHDLILLENQIPWMVLEHLFMLIKPPHSMNLIEFAIKFFGRLFPFLQPADGLNHKEDDPEGANRDIKHIPDLFKTLLGSSSVGVAKEENLSSRSEHSYTPLVEGGIESSSSPNEVDEEENLASGSGHSYMPLEGGNESSSSSELVPSATRLVEAGIKFRASTSSKSIFDINFTRDGVLEIPQITINDLTETFFRNLISFEQCYPYHDDRVTSYAILLDNLITTTKDVEILSENKILEIWLNPEDVAQFFNKLYHDTCIQDEYYYEEICTKVNDYRKSKWNTWRALLMSKYFNTPWAGISTFAAVILLLMTFVQTCYSIASYYNV